ncbi:MAG: hypothetical protein V3U92_07095 [Cellulophaga sp.]
MSTHNEHNTDYRKTVLISSNKEDVFKALTEELSNWWGTMDNIVQKKEDIFTVSWGEPWYKFKVVELNPFSIITWECIDCNQIIGDLEGVEKEWVGTRLQWEIKTIKHKEVEVSLIHQGLIPEFTCYKVCSSAWDSFIGTNLKDYLEGVNN